MTAIVAGLIAWVIAAWLTVGVTIVAVCLLYALWCRLSPGLRRGLRRFRSRCGCCPPKGVMAPLKLRAWALVLPGDGWGTRVRHGLGRAEYAERVRFGMAMDHPDWITGELPDEFEELLAELDAMTWEGS